MAKTYDPKEVQLIFGAAIINGFADGSFITVERTSDTWGKFVGSTGEVARAKTNDKSGRLTFQLIQTSASNDILSAFAITDELTNAGILPLLIKDNLGTTILAAAQAWIVKPANVEYARDIVNREWMIDCSSIDMFIGGN